MDEPYEFIPLEQLHLDLRNDRIGEAEDESEATVRMFDEAGAHLRALAEHILANGMNRGTPLCLIPRPEGGYTVVDGNRRLVTLRALTNPDIIPTTQTEIRQAFERYNSRGAEFPSALPSVIYSTREEADIWVDLMHGGPGKGEGTVAWSSEAKANRRRRRKGVINPGHETWLWIRKTYSRDTVISDLYRRVKAKQYTFMDRLAKVDRFKQLLGLSFTAEGASSSKNPAELAPVVEKVLNDIDSGRIKARKLHTTDDIRQYVDDTLSPLLGEQATFDIDVSNIQQPANTVRPTSTKSPVSSICSTSLSPGQSDQDSSEDDQTQELDASPYPAPIQPPQGINERSRLFPGVAFKAFTPKINALGKQAQKISVDANPETCGVLCRVIIDLATINFLSRHGNVEKNLENEHLWKRIRSTLQRLDPTTSEATCSNKPLRNVFLACNQGGSGLAVQQLHTFVHDILRSRSGSEVDQFNQLFTPLLIAMEESLSQPASPVATKNETRQP